MALRISILVILGCAFVVSVPIGEKTAETGHGGDLTAAASSYLLSGRGSSYPGSFGTLGTGYGSLDGYGYDVINKPTGYSGYGANGGFGSNIGYGDNSGYAGNNGYGRNSGYGGNSGNGGNIGYGGNGGYGGYGGNGGLSSYSGYNNPYYQGAYHTGYGYYNKPGYGSIYGSSITPNVVTGYRGYSKK